MDTNKKYKVIKASTGNSPHILENVEDTNDKVFLCSCGGTKNKDGHCDGSHKKKGQDGCQCYYCKDVESRAKVEA